MQLAMQFGNCKVIQVVTKSDGIQSSTQGYEITDAAPADLRNKLGLRSGDKIVSLNGRPLGQVQNDVRLLQQIQQQRSTVPVVATKP